MDEEVARLPSLHPERWGKDFGRLLEEAQAEATARGHPGVVSGWLLLAAGSGSNDVARTLLDAVGTDPTSLSKAVEMEWETDSVTPDRPRNVMHQAIASAVSSPMPSGDASVYALLSATMDFDDSMATRVVRRLGASPAEVAIMLRRSA